MNDISSFSHEISQEDSVERLYLNGSTCDTYVVRIMGKLHFKKKLKAGYSGNPQYTAAFRKEFETGYRLEHPALPRYMFFGEEDGCPYILEEYIDGETLTSFMKDHPDYFHSRSHADTFIDQLLSVMSYLHEHQVLYLDLKPDNILITSVGHQLRLVDLGGCHTDSWSGTEQETRSFAHPDNAATADDNGEDGLLCKESTDVYLIGRVLQYADVAHIYNKVVARCLKDSSTDRYKDVESLRKAVASVRYRRKAGYAIAALAGIVIIGASALLLLPDRQEPTHPTAVSSLQSDTADSLQRGNADTLQPRHKEMATSEVKPTTIAPPQDNTKTETKAEAKAETKKHTTKEKAATDGTITGVTDKRIVGTWVLKAILINGQDMMEPPASYMRIKYYGADGEYGCAEVVMKSDGSHIIRPHEYGTYAFSGDEYMEMGHKGKFVITGKGKAEGTYMRNTEYWEKKSLPADLLEEVMDRLRGK